MRDDFEESWNLQQHEQSSNGQLPRLNWHGQGGEGGPCLLGCSWVEVTMASGALTTSLLYMGLCGLLGHSGQGCDAHKTRGRSSRVSAGPARTSLYWDHTALGHERFPPQL